jgi:hypothetical protein
LKTQVGELKGSKTELTKLKGQIKAKMERRFPLSMKKGPGFDVPDGIIAHLTKECGGNVHDRNGFEVTSSKQHTDGYWAAAMTRPKNVPNLGEGEDMSCFFSAFRNKEDDIPHTRNNWICYDIKNRTIAPTHYAIRTYRSEKRGWHLKSWLVELSTDGKSWQEVDR